MLLKGNQAHIILEFIRMNEQGPKQTMKKERKKLYLFEEEEET